MRQSVLYLALVITGAVLAAARPAGAQVFIDGLAQPVFSVSGWLAFELQPHDHIFPAGSQIGLVLLGGDWEGNPPLVFTMRPPPGTEIRIDTLESTFNLPIVGGAAALAAALQ